MANIVQYKPESKHVTKEHSQRLCFSVINDLFLYGNVLLLLFYARLAVFMWVWEPAGLMLNGTDVQGSNVTTKEKTWALPAMFFFEAQIGFCLVFLINSCTAVTFFVMKKKDIALWLVPKKAQSTAGQSALPVGARTVDDAEARRDTATIIVLLTTHLGMAGGLAFSEFVFLLNNLCIGLMDITPCCEDRIHSIGVFIPMSSLMSGIFVLAFLRYYPKHINGKVKQIRQELLKHVNGKPKCGKALNEDGKPKKSNEKELETGTFSHVVTENETLSQVV